MAVEGRHFDPGRWKLLRDDGCVFACGTARVPPVIVAPPDLEPNTVEELAKLEPPVVAFRCTADFDPYGRLPCCWTGVTEYDDDHVDKSLSILRQACPRSWFIAAITTCSPPWWDAANPGELVVWWDGSTEQVLGHGCRKTRVPSSASEKWRLSMCRNLARLVSRLETGEHGDRIIGYTVEYGTLGAWVPFGVCEGILFDYNPHMATRFREWLMARYRSAKALSAAWGEDRSFAGVELPTPGERIDVDLATFRHPIDQRHVVDFHTCLTEQLVDLLAAAAGAVKESSNGRALVGAPYGNLLGMLHFHDGLQYSGQLGIRRVLADPNVDFLVAPTERVTPAASVREHRKFLFCGPGLPFAPDEAASSVSVRGGDGLWQADLARAEPSVARGPAAGRRVAFVLDETSMYLVQRPPEQLQSLITNQLDQLLVAKLPFEVILRNDLTVDSPYRFVIFTNFFHADESARQETHEVLRALGATALWIGLPGIVDRDTSFENVEKLVGIRVAKPARMHEPLIRPLDDIPGSVYGFSGIEAHAPIITDPDCRILGSYEGSSLPGLGSRELHGWRSIFSGVPGVPAQLLRRFAVDAGVLEMDRRER